MSITKYIIGLIISILFFIGQIHSAEKAEITIPKIIIQGIPATINFTFNESYFEDTVVAVFINDEKFEIAIENGLGFINHRFFDRCEVSVEQASISATVRPIPLWLSILPPLLAILLALIFKEVITALFFGLFVGSGIIEVYHTGELFLGLTKGILSIMDEYIIVALNDSGHLSIIVFSMLIGAMVNVITRNAGMKGVVDKISRFANSRRSGMFATWLLGIAIFFDDYANTLVVGNTMRPVTDKLKISRQKLAYLVDSTAAPIAAIGFVTTWIGAELSYIQSGISTLGLNLSPYNVFLSSLPYSFYPIFTLIFILFLIQRNVDYGPMLKYERKAQLLSVEDGSEENSFSNNVNDIEVSESIDARWYNAVIPIFIIIFGTFAGLIYTGINAVELSPSLSLGQKLSLIIGASDSYLALLWSSLTATIVSVLLTVSQRLLSLKDTIDSIIDGFRTMLTAIIILILAWSIALVTENLHTADFISNFIIETNVSPILIPTITFVLACLVAFSTGSSWGTMAILYPLILPASWLVTAEFGYTYDHSLNIFYNVVASVLAGSVLGDHCSPISDTTILSSLASSCPHIEHVKTQLPYALTVGAVSILFGILPASFGVSPYITFPLGLFILYMVVRLFGKKI